MKVEPSVVSRRDCCGVVWASDPKKNLDNRANPHLIGYDSPCGVRHPATFVSRRAAREWIIKHYGYLSARRDLREYPHGWLMPRPIKLTLTLENRK